VADAAIANDYKRGNDPRSELTKTADAGMIRAANQIPAVTETDANQNCGTHRIQTQPHLMSASKSTRREKLQTPKIAISLLNKQELQDSGLKISAQFGIRSSQWP